MRDVIVSLVILSMLPVCFRKPFLGLALFSLMAYLRVQDLTWGFARHQRWSFYIAVVTFAGFFAMRGQKRFMQNDIRCWVMIGLSLVVPIGILASGTAHPRDIKGITEFGKIITVALFTTGIVTRRDHLRVLVWVVAFSFGFYGMRSGISGILSGGSLQILQGPGGMMADNNDFAMALCMGLPLMFHIGLSEKSALVRRMLLTMVPMTMITIILTHSRGAFLALSCTVFLLVWRSHNRLAGMSAGILLVLSGLILAPASYTERLGTLSNVEEDGSAMGRLDAWRTAGEMIKGNPILGVGFGKFEDNYERYDPKRVEGRASGSRVAHNSYLQIWAECGTPAFLMYLSLILLSFVDVWRVRKEARTRYFSSWILNYCTMFECTLLAFSVGAMFLNRAHFDLFYHMVAIIVCFGTIARAEMRTMSVRPAQTSGRGMLVPLSQPGFGAHNPGLVSSRHSGFRNTQLVNRA